VIGPGATLARYRVESKLGEGGMGVVWKATDVTLHRAVALKVLPEAFARDPERVARFEREARVLASLNHPNIAAIYGLETDGPLRVLAMEYVPGDTLAARLARGALPVAEALPIALKIAEALESAHERGIVHRDLKPANVAVTPEGDVKLLDFGLARAFAPDGEITSRTDDSPTISAVMTRGDVILGTAAYMSPEQARGKLVDRRSDIWAFGLVLFEMLTGRQVFEGETTSDLLAAVLRQDVPWQRLPAATPPHVRALLERCLTRDPRVRLRDIGEARIALAHAPAVAASRRAGIPRWVLPALGVVLAAAVTWFLARRSNPPAAIGPMRAFEIASVQDPKASEPALSPDGESIAYVDQGQLWVRELGQLQARSLVTDPEARKPFWSPDGKSIGFLSAAHLNRVPAAGGAVETIAEFPVVFGLGGDAATWDDKGHVIVSQGTTRGLIEIPEHGGEARTIVAADTTRESDFHEPFLLPGGRGMLVVAHRKQGADNISLVRGGKVTPVLVLPEQLLGSPQYSPTGHIVFERTTQPAGVWAVPFSLTSLRTTGEPFLVVPDGMEPSIGRDGSLAYVAPAAQPLEFCWVDRTGAVVQHLAPLGRSAEDGGVFDVSPEGTRAVITLGSAADLWIYDFVRGSRTQLTNHPGLEVNGHLHARRHVGRLPDHLQPHGRGPHGMVPDPPERRRHRRAGHAGQGRHAHALDLGGRPFALLHAHRRPDDMEARIATLRDVRRARRPDGRPADRLLPPPLAGRPLSGLQRERRAAQRQPAGRPDVACIRGDGGDRDRSLAQLEPARRPPLLRPARRRHGGQDRQGRSARDRTGREAVHAPAGRAADGLRLVAAVRGARRPLSGPAPAGRDARDERRARPELAGGVPEEVIATSLRP
jgi:serine/threonine-protein kinase